MKEIYKSKTFWLNAIILLIAIFSYGAGNSGISEIIPPEVLLGAVSLLNLALRVIGGQPLSVGGKTVFNFKKK